MEHQRVPVKKMLRHQFVVIKVFITRSKELIIRRWLAESHLKSSAFEVRWEGDEVVLPGGGWGHGVGLCQIGAAVMASRGYGYKEILAWYYPGSQIDKCYD